MSDSEKDETTETQPEAEPAAENAAGNGIEANTENTAEEEENASADEVDDSVIKADSDADELITQDEMDTLLKGVSEGDLDVETVSDLEPGTARKYDFAHPAHKLNAHLPIMSVINDRIAKKLGPDLSAQFHQPVNVSIEDFSACKFQEYTHSLPTLVSINRIKLHPLPTSSLISMDGGLIFTLVDSFFGGTGQRGNKDITRAFTPTEQRIIQKTVDTMLEAVKQAWQPTFPLNPEFMRSELSTEITSPTNPAEVLLVTRFKIGLEFGSGEMHIAIPYSSIEPARPALTAALDKPNEDDNQWASDFTEMVIDAPIELQGIIAETDLTLGELLSLKAGDFIPLGKGNIASFYSENIPLFEASIGASNGMISAQLIDQENSYPQ